MSVIPRSSSLLVLVLLFFASVVVEVANSFVLPAPSSQSRTTSKRKSTCATLKVIEGTESNDNDDEALEEIPLVAKSPLADEALACFPYELRSDDDPKAPSFMCSITKTQALTAFDELSRLYGAQRALDTIKIQPLALATNPNNFAPTLDVWTATFGLEAAQGMVARNPGLLLVGSVKTAASDAFGAMGWSYMIWATRPIYSKLLVVGYAFYQYNAAMSAGDDFFPWHYHIQDTGSGIQIIVDSLFLPKLCG